MHMFLAGAKSAGLDMILVKEEEEEGRRRKTTKKPKEKGVARIPKSDLKKKQSIFSKISREDFAIFLKGEIWLADDN